MNFSIDATAGTADLQISSNKRLKFPTDCYVVGQASTTLTSIATINTKLKTTSFTDTGNFINEDQDGNVITQEFQLIPYNNLVYLIRAVANVDALSVVGGLGVTSGLLIDTYVPTASGNLALAQGARYKRSGMQYFGSSYTPVTMVDSLDTLDFTSITGGTLHVPPSSFRSRSWMPRRASSPTSPTSSASRCGPSSTRRSSPSLARQLAECPSLAA